jgi:DnaJ-class molecular chaperone
LRWGIPVFQPCADCRDSGRQGQYSCQPCKESGLLEEDPSIRIDIPPGVPDGAIFSCRCAGWAFKIYHCACHCVSLLITKQTQQTISRNPVKAFSVPSASDPPA